MFYQNVYNLYYYQQSVITHGLEGNSIQVQWHLLHGWQQEKNMVKYITLYLVKIYCFNQIKVYWILKMYPRQKS